MKAVVAKTQVRTPEQLAKAQMKQKALQELHAAGLDSSANITIEYMGIRHSLPATTTVNVKTGQIMFHFGAVGANRLLFAPEGHEFAFGVGGNIMTGLAIDNWEELRAKYGLPAMPGVDETSDEALSATESTE